MNKFLLKSNSNDGDVYMETHKRFCHHLACISLIIYRKKIPCPKSTSSYRQNLNIFIYKWITEVIIEKTN